MLSDGDPSLVGAVRAAVRGPVTHILDWFHISMRVRHIEQALTGLLGSDLDHKGPLDYTGFNVNRLRHQIWDGYAEEARRTLPSIRQTAANAVVLNGQQGRASPHRAFCSARARARDLFGAERQCADRRRTPFSRQPADLDLAC